MDKNWRDKYKGLEQQYRILKDDYSEIVRELGFPSYAVWGDTFVCQAEIIAKVKELVGGS